MKTDSQALGRWGEEQAARFLTERGYSILERNVRTPYGEIDLIARQADGMLIFVEVKARASELYGQPEVSVTPKKKQHLLAAIQTYLQTHPELGENCRCDVIAIRRRSPGEPPEITHFENAVS